MKEMQDAVDMKAIDAYAAKDADYQKRLAELEEITNQRDEVRERHEDLRKKRLDEFMAGFLTISCKLKEMYQMITLGGDAELELVDTLDPFSEARACCCGPPRPLPHRVDARFGTGRLLCAVPNVIKASHSRRLQRRFLLQMRKCITYVLLKLQPATTT
jgi:hypothetical protein